MRSATLSTAWKLLARPQHATVKDLDTQTSQRSACNATPWTNAKPRQEDDLLALAGVLLIIQRPADATSTKMATASLHPSTLFVSLMNPANQSASNDAMTVDAARSIDTLAAAVIDHAMSGPRLAPYHVS